MIVIGLSGYKGSGKDTVADILVRDYGFTKMSFAEPLKRMLKALDPIVGYDHAAYYCDCDGCRTEVYPVTLGTMYDEWGLTTEEIKASEFGEEVRRLWERFGTEVMREEDPDYWVRKSAQAMAASDADRIVFTDVRFENEADFIIGLDNHHSGYYESALWRVSRPGQEPGDHSSDQMAGLLGETVTVVNDGSLDDLSCTVDLAFSALTMEIPGQLAFDFGATNE